MDYLSTKQTAELWGISPRRIVLLASQGRISGAKQIDGRWFIPEGTSKPQNPRSRQSAQQSDDENRYVFPFLLACVNSEEQIAQFTPDEKKLYELCLTYETGDFVRARKLAEELLSCNNQYIRLGALYHLPVICMYQNDYEWTDKYTVLFRTACHDCKDHKNEIALILSEFNSEFVSTSGLEQDLRAIDLNKLPDNLLPWLSTCTLFVEINKLCLNRTTADLSHYEIYCRMIESQGYFFIAICMHAYLSAYYALQKSTDKEHYHLKKALDMSLEHGTIFTIAYSMAFNHDTSQKILREYPREIAKQFRAFAEIFANGRNGYYKYRGIKNALEQLSEEDYSLITLCLKNHSIEEMSERFGLSRSGMNRRLSKLYSKLNVNSKSELIQVYLGSVCEWK